MALASSRLASAPSGIRTSSAPRLSAS
jgi:hypothetical protein